MKKDIPLKRSFEEFAEEEFKELIKVLQDKDLSVKEKMEEITATLFALLDFMREEVNGEKTPFLVLGSSFKEENGKELGFLISFVADGSEKEMETLVDEIYHFLKEKILKKKSKNG